MRNTLKQAKRLAQEGFTQAEMKEILQRAAELQSQAEWQIHDQKVQREVMEASAKAAGIRNDFLEQAIEEFKVKRRPKTKRKPKGWGIALAFVVGLLAVPIALFTLGVIGFSVGITLTVLAAIGLALAVVGFAFLLTMPFIGIRLAASLLVTLNQFAKRLSNPRTWRHLKDDDDDDD